ncbi:asparagine synthase (glutamine-hydrolysing) [Hydrogenispora ethanolica]|uniref:asparagine synthase (glutamine-hydrolyzing) n=1 Tax=Hydrogenispora ethanolica TaxID=1082276 RepID=A0A4R1RMC2_HYDET|nr:asparagine synthase (glutamine-hydrolyzing) [Hydrogenispora ethanolica]TCL67421.1 asparagine synthase (glutamine-hydrolysing) [Hydrogenispora ethanolica]
MCGIAGWVDWEADLTRERALLEEMTRRLSDRGPDAEGYWTSRHAAIGHRRLIVVDPAGGWQPMIKRYGERTYVLTYNGELYNTAEVRAELEAKGHRFDSYSDTEVVLVAYIEWGPDCVERFNGIYAIGIWSEYDQSLFLARDRMGVKPLFYCLRGGTLIFGSEIKALLAHPRVEAVLDRDGVAEIFGLGPARTPGKGVLKGIAEVRPGYWLLYDRANGLKQRQYWELESRPHTDGLETTVERVRELVVDAIRRQLVSDVPVCTFLSGGLDSSVISTVAARDYQAEGKEPLRTFSIDYRDNDKYFKPSAFQPNPDQPWIERMAGFLGTRHFPVVVDTPEVYEALRGAVLARDLPGMADIDSSLWLFCREIKKEATVALSGECADEVFGGYPWFHRPEAVAADTFPWSLAVDFRSRLLAPEWRDQIDLRRYVTDRYRETLAEVPRLPGEDPTEERRRELFYLNLHWFMQVLLDRKDRMSMAHGLEVRVPYCDHRIVEYVWNIPWAMKTCEGREKGILRRAVADMLPEDVVWRKKSPYPKTHNPDYFERVKRELQTILEAPDNRLRELIDVSTLAAAVQQPDFNVPWFGQLMTVPQLLAYLIQLEIWLKEYRVVIE